MQIEWLSAGSSIGFPPIDSALRYLDGLSACVRERRWLDQYEQSSAAHSPCAATDAHAD
jgi:hypothetical protein